MKLTIDVEIDWIDEDGSLDDAVEKKITDKVTEKLVLMISNDVGNQIGRTATNYIKAKTEQIINTVLEQPITITNGWSDKKTYDSIFDMIEQQMSTLYKGKIDTTGGKCKKDPLLENIERYVKNETDKLLIVLDKRITKSAKDQAKKAVDDNALIQNLNILMRDRPVVS